MLINPDTIRRKSRKIKIGNISIGGNSDITVQSMTTTDTTNVDETVKQVHILEEAGCDIVRISAPTMDSAIALKSIKENISIPLVADIHFDYRIALEAAKYADKIRINPGNIGSEDKVRQVVEQCKQHSIPMRIGVNLGSLQRDLEQKYGYTAPAMIESALRHCSLVENMDFHDIVVSLKASEVPIMIEAYRKFAEKTDYPLHLGVTEAGRKFEGSIKSAIGIGILLSEGIGDTIRVSLSDEPVEEVKAGWSILKSLKLRKRGIEITSCPTCARTDINVIKLAEEIERRTAHIKDSVHVAIMGCAVNGPGESKRAEIGIVGGPDKHLVYVDGKIQKWTSEKEAADEIVRMIEGKIGKQIY